MAVHKEVHELDRGDIVMWIDDGVIMLKVVTPSGDPVELNEDEARRAAELLLKLVKVCEETDWTMENSETGAE